MALVNQADKYLDMDQRIYENYSKTLKDRGWSREKRSAAKIPPNVLFGLQRSETLTTGITRTNLAAAPRNRAAGTSSAAHFLPPKSKGSLRSKKSYIAKQPSGGLGFSAGDIGSMNINTDYYNGG